MFLCLTTGDHLVQVLEMWSTSAMCLFPLCANVIFNKVCWLFIVSGTMCSFGLGWWFGWFLLSDKLQYFSLLNAAVVWMRSYVRLHYCYITELDISYVLPFRHNLSLATYAKLTCTPEVTAFLVFFEIACFSLHDIYHVFQESNNDGRLVYIEWLCADKHVLSRHIHRM